MVGNQFAVVCLLWVCYIVADRLIFRAAFADVQLHNSRDTMVRPQKTAYRSRPFLLTLLTSENIKFSLPTLLFNLSDIPAEQHKHRHLCGKRSRFLLKSSGKMALAFSRIHFIFQFQQMYCCIFNLF